MGRRLRKFKYGGPISDLLASGMGILTVRHSARGNTLIIA